MQQHRCNRVERASNGETPYRLRPHRLATALTEEVILVRAVQFRAIIERAAMLVAAGLYRATVCQVWQYLLHNERSERGGRTVGLSIQSRGGRGRGRRRRRHSLVKHGACLLVSCSSNCWSHQYDELLYRSVNLSGNDVLETNLQPREVARDKWREAESGSAGRRHFK